MEIVQELLVHNANVIHPYFGKQCGYEFFAMTPLRKAMRRLDNEMFLLLYDYCSPAEKVAAQDLLIESIDIGNILVIFTQFSIEITAFLQSFAWQNSEEML